MATETTHHGAAAAPEGTGAQRHHDIVVAAEEVVQIFRELRGDCLLPIGLTMALGILDGAVAAARIRP